MLKNRKVPVVYTGKKEQAAYAEIIKDRNENLKDDVLNNRLVYDTLLLNKSNAILQRMKAANRSYSFDSISLFINRSAVPNASCFGEGTLYINAGLFLITDNDDELALVLGHELAHQFLRHSEKQLKKYIALLSSDDFRDELRSIKKSSEGKYERYRELMKDIATQNGKHSRFGESEADSLGAVLIKNAGYNVKKAAVILLKLDHADDLYTGARVYNVRAGFGFSDTAVVKKKSKYNGLSMETVTMNADKDFDSVKTHPDCKLRYTALTKEPPQNVNCCKVLSANEKPVRERVLTELVRDAYETKQFTLCAHFCLFALKNGLRDPFYYSMLSGSFSGIAEAEKKLEKFSVTNTYAAPGSTLKELQDYIFSADSRQIANNSFYFMDKALDSCDDRSFAALMYNIHIKGGNEADMKNKFTSEYPNNKYNYLLKSKTAK